MIGISESEFNEWGCPYCGCDYTKVGHLRGDCIPVFCSDCESYFMVMADGIEVSTVGVGTDRKDENGKTIMEYPRRTPHPRKGISKYKNQTQDIRPDDGIGEFWESRGVGGAVGDLDISGFVKSRQAGERILEIVKKLTGKEKPDSWLDYRKDEPNRIQFKFKNTEFNVDMIDILVGANNGVITEEILKEALKKRVISW